MEDAEDGFTEMISDPDTSYDVSEMVTDQQQALEALLRAIQALQPPQKGDQDQQDGEDEQDQNQNGEQQQQQAGDMSQRQAQRKMQAAKEKEAKRDQDQQTVPVAGGFVEKDW